MDIDAEEERRQARERQRIRLRNQMRCYGAIFVFWLVWISSFPSYLEDFMFCSFVGSFVALGASAVVAIYYIYRPWDIKDNRKRDREEELQALRVITDITQRRTQKQPTRPHAIAPPSPPSPPPTPPPPPPPPTPPPTPPPAYSSESSSDTTDDELQPLINRK